MDGSSTSPLGTKPACGWPKESATTSAQTGPVFQLLATGATAPGKADSPHPTQAAEPDTVTLSQITVTVSAREGLVPSAHASIPMGIALLSAHGPGAGILSLDLAVPVAAPSQPERCYGT